MRVNVPWALEKPKHYFTHYFDALILTLAKDMPMNAISRWIGEHDTRLWRILHHYVDNAIAVQDLFHVTAISTDETSAKRGHDYITIFMDPEQTQRYRRCQRQGRCDMGRVQRTLGNSWRRCQPYNGSLYGTCPRVHQGAKR